nr:protein kinase [Bifidobacterium rousetti]
MSDVNALTLEPGEVVGGYTLISRLGSGAMGSVWRVSDDGGQVYAMKILRDSLSDDFADAASGPGSRQSPQDPNLKDHVTARERLRREAMALKKVNHPGVCGIVDMELDDALAFIVTELIEGRNLRDDVAANGRYVGDDLERLARKLIEAVKAVHAAGIVHRDIKPTNVMISATGPILVDFGIAMGEGESHVTRTGLVMGTPGFIAPEIIEGAESDESTDWWSVASVLAFAAMGEPVFGTKPMMAVLEREASGNANLAGLPAHTMTAFRSALNPDPTKRCTPDQLLHAIALDALNPLGWPGGDGSALTGGNVGGVYGNAGGAGNANSTAPAGSANGVMHPFGRDTRRDAVDPNAVSTRTLWPGAAADGDATAILNETGSNVLAATRALTPDQCTVALPSDRLGPNDIPGLLCPPPPPDARVTPAQATTRAMPSTGRTVRGVSGATGDGHAAFGNPGNLGNPGNPGAPNVAGATTSVAGTSTNPAARPVLRRLANNANQSFDSVSSAQFPQVGQQTVQQSGQQAGQQTGQRAGQDGTATERRPRSAASSTSSTSAQGSMPVSAPPRASARDNTADVPPAYVPPAPLQHAHAEDAERKGQESDDAGTATQLIPPMPPESPADATAGRPQRTTIMPQRAPGTGAASRAPQTDSQPMTGRPLQTAQPVQATRPLIVQPPVMQPPQNQNAPLNYRTAPAEQATQAMGTVPEFLRVPPQNMPPQGAPQNMPPVMPTPMDQQPYGRSLPNHANTADLLRDQYLSRGTLPSVALAVIPAFAAAMWPPAGLIAAAILLWLLFTVGYSQTAQLDRESRRGGERRGSDTALRVVQLPWHLLKGLIATVARTAQFAAIVIVIMTIAVLALNLPWEPMPIPGGYWPYQIPWLADDGPLTPTSLTAGGTTAVAWILTALWPYSHTLRLAAGSLRGHPVD